MPKILLVEDDNNLREIFQMRLEAEGYATVVAADGEEGLVVAMKEKPDLIIADVMMPKLSGFEMIENLRSAPEMKDTKIIMMTALGQAEDQARGEKLGVVKYLVKSQVTLEDFARVVKEVLGPGNPADVTAAQQVENPSNNIQESEKSMPEDTSPTNPMSTPNDTSTPSEPAAPSSNPMSDAGQQSAADEQGAVQDQINDFASSAPTPAPDDTAPAEPVTPSESAAPAADPTMPGSGDTGAPAMPSAPAEPAAPSDPMAPSEPAAPSEGDQSGSAPTDSTSNAL